MISLSSSDPDIEFYGEQHTFTLECSGDNDLVSTSCVSTGTSMADCTFDVQDDQNGSVECLATVDDGNGASDFEIISLIVNAINDLPILTAVGNQSTDEDEDLTISVSASDVDIVENGQSLSFSLVCGEESLVTTSCLDDTCTFDVQDDQFGQTDCYVNVDDNNGGLDSENITLIVHPINDPMVESLCPRSNWDIEFSDDPSITNKALLTFETDYNGASECFGVYDIDSELSFKWTVIDMNEDGMDTTVVWNNTLEFYSSIDSDLFIDLDIYETHQLDIDSDGILDGVETTIEYDSIDPYMIAVTVSGCDGNLAEYDECDVCSGCGLMDWYLDEDADCWSGEILSQQYCSEIGESSPYPLADLDNWITNDECFEGECFYGDDANDVNFCESNQIDSCDLCDGCDACYTEPGDADLNFNVDVLDIMYAIDYLFTDLSSDTCEDVDILNDDCPEDDIQFSNLNVAQSELCNEPCNGCIDIVDITVLIDIILKPCTEFVTEDDCLGLMQADYCDWDESEGCYEVDPLARETANRVEVLKTSNGLELDSDGYVSLHITLNHSLDFNFELTNGGLIQDYITNGNRTDVILLRPESGTILATSDWFEVVDIMASSGENIIDVEYDVVPDQFQLNDAYPNPFNPVTNISYSLPIASEISIKIFDIQGREVSILYNNIQESGTHKLVWDASNFSSGIYFVRMSGGSYSGMKKLMLIK